MSTTASLESATIQRRDARRPSRRNHARFAAALAGFAMLLVPAIADAAVEGWGSAPAVGLGGEQFPSIRPTLIPEAQEATAAAVGANTSYVLTPSGVLSSATGTFKLIPGTAGAKAVATGGGATFNEEQSTLILEAGGTVDGFGGNAYGESGGTPGTVIETPTPIAGLSDVTSIAVSYSSSVALKADGTVWAWGNHAYLGSTAGASGPDTGTPIQVTLPAGNPATAISAGSGHFLVLLQDGSVWAWGGNESGQVGDGSTDSVTVPVQVIPPAASGDPKATSLSAGSQSSFVLYDDGTFKAWGAGYDGRLGLGRTLDAEEAVTVPTSPDPAAVAAHPDAYPPLRQIVSTRATTYGIVADSGQVLVWGSSGGFGFGEDPPSYTYAFPYDPANPDTPGVSGQGATTIPQRLGQLKNVPWLGVGALSSAQIASSDPVLRFLPFASGPAFFEHPVGTVSAPQLQYFGAEEPTEVTSIQITGANAADFTIVSTGLFSGYSTTIPGQFLPLPMTISGGAGVLVRFNPSGLGDREATLKVFGKSETTSMQLTGYGAALPGNTPGAKGDKGGPGAAGPAGPPGPAGPAGKDGVVVFASSKAKVSAKRGGTAALSFLLVNGTSEKLYGATVQAAVPKTLGAPGAVGPVAIAALRAGSSRQVKVGLKIADGAKLGTQSVKVAFKAGAKTVTRAVSVRVTG